MTTFKLNVQNQQTHKDRKTNGYQRWGAHGLRMGNVCLRIFFFLMGMGAKCSRITGDGCTTVTFKKYLLNCRITKEFYDT